MDDPRVLRTIMTGYPDKQPVRNPIFGREEAKYKPSRFERLLGNEVPK